MKKIVGVLLALAMMVSLAVPVMAVSAEPSAEYEVSYEDAQWEKGYDDGYQLGYEDAAAGRERSSLEYQDGSSYEDGMIFGYDMGYDAFLDEQQSQESANQAIVKAGGVLGRINVKLNDQCVVFPDAVPEVQNGTTMVPVAALMKAIGADVQLLESNIVKIVYGNTNISMKLGDQVATVETNGASEQVALGVASYLKNDRVYIPLRIVSEGFGFEVRWDQDYQSVVILDRAAIVNELNERFTTANVFMKSQGKLLEGNWLTEGTFNVSVEIIDSINGNKTYTAAGTSKTHSGGGALSMEGTVDLSKFAGMIDGFAPLADGEDASGLAMLKSYMKMNRFSLKFVPEGDYYIQSELYDQIVTNVLGLSIDENKETWYRMGHIDSTLLTAEGYTMGNYLYTMADPEITLQTPFMTYDTLMQAAAQLERFMGNDCFKQQGDRYVLSINKEQIFRLIGEDEELQKELNSVFQELTLSLSFTKDGVYSIQGAVKLKVDGLGALMDLTLDQNGTGTSETGTMKLQLRNLFNVTMKAASKASKAQTAPDTSLPKDAQIIDLMELFQQIP